METHSRENITVETRTLRIAICGVDDRNTLEGYGLNIDVRGYLSQ